MAKLFRYRVVNSKGGVILFRASTARKLQQQVVKAGKNAPSPPKHFGETVTRVRRAKAGVNLLGKKSMTVVADATSLRRRAAKGRTVLRNPKVGTYIDSLEPGDWGEILMKLGNHAHLRQSRRVNALKGVFNELAIRQLPEYRELLGRCASKVDKVTGWHPPIVVRGARTKSGIATGELGDYVVLSMSKSRDPQRVWVMAVVESKSRYNAIELIHKGEFTGIPDTALEGRLGEMLGQGEGSVERIKVFGLDLDSTVQAGGLEVKGMGDFEPDNVRIRHDPGRKPADQVTELIGVIPTDTNAPDLRTIENAVEHRGLLVWKHPISDADATSLAEDLIAAFDDGQ